MSFRCTNRVVLCSPRTRAALKYFLYGDNTQLDIKRVEALASGFQSFRSIMAASHGGPDVPPPKVNYLDPTTKEALRLLFAPEGSYIQELILTEVKFHMLMQVESKSSLTPCLFSSLVFLYKFMLTIFTSEKVLRFMLICLGASVMNKSQVSICVQVVRAVDALSREALAELWQFFSQRGSLPSTMAIPGSWPLPSFVLGGALGGRQMARLSAEDYKSLDLVRRLWILVEPHLMRPTTATGKFSIQCSRCSLVTYQSFY